MKFRALGDTIKALPLFMVAIQTHQSGFCSTFQPKTDSHNFPTKDQAVLAKK